MKNLKEIGQFVQKSSENVRFTKKLGFGEASFSLAE
jgi:hypothetical protein